MAVFYLCKNDTLPVLVVTLLDPDGSVHDLTGATSATLHVRDAEGNKLSAAMTIDPDPTTGKVSYTFTAANWTAGAPMAVGYQRMEYEIAGPGGAVLTFPNGLEKDELRITEELDA